MERLLARLGSTLGMMLFLAGAVAAAPAQGYIYFLAHASGINRMNLDGTHLRKALVGHPFGSALAITSSHLYWLDDNTSGFNGGGAVAQANLDGSHVKRHFVPAGNWSSVTPPGLAVSSSEIYFTDPAPSQYYNTIARVGIGGGGLKPSFIEDSADWINNGGPTHLAIQGRYLYWFDSQSIGRAGLDGLGVRDHYVTHLPAMNLPGGFAISGAYAYWTLSKSIARVALGGQGLRAKFIRGLHDPDHLEIFNGHIYWAEGTAIRRANLDGTHVRTLYTGSPWFDVVNGIAIDGRGG